MTIKRARDYASEDASRTRARTVLRLTEDERDELETLRVALGAHTLSGAAMAAVACARALVAGEGSDVAIDRACEVAAMPPPQRGWTKGKARGPRSS